MLRDEINYAEFHQRANAARLAREDARPNVPVPLIGQPAWLRGESELNFMVEIAAEMYLPYQQITHNPWFVPRDLAIRTTDNATNLVSSVRQAIREVDPDQPVSNVATMAEFLGEEAAQRRMGMIMLVAFASLVLLLASLGIYGVLTSLRNTQMKLV